MVADFKYVRANTLFEVFENMEANRENRLYSGGTDLLVKMKSGMLNPDIIIDIKDVLEVNGITEEDNCISIGAATTFAQLYKDERIVEWLPGLAQASRLVGSGQIQRKGTIGGNICNASPAADGLTSLWALGTKVQLVSRYKTRTVPVEEFVRGPGKTIIQPSEVLCRIIVPKQDWTEQRFFKVGRRNALAISVINGCVSVRKNQEQRITGVNISIGACGLTPIQIEGVEELLLGKALSQKLIDEVGNRVKNMVHPISDIRAGAEYRRYMAYVMVKEILSQNEGRDG